MPGCLHNILCVERARPPPRQWFRVCVARHLRLTVWPRSGRGSRTQRSFVGFGLRSTVRKEHQRASRSSCSVHLPSGSTHRTYITKNLTKNLINDDQRHASFPTTQVAHAGVRSHRSHLSAWPWTSAPFRRVKPSYVCRVRTLRT